MKKKNGLTFGQKLAKFFRHYALLLLAAVVCSVLTVILVTFVI